MASETPVFPEVASTIVPPSWRSPRASASSTMASAMRSLTDPPGIQAFELGEDAGGASGKVPELDERGPADEPEQAPVAGAGARKGDVHGHEGGHDNKKSPGASRGFG